MYVCRLVVPFLQGYVIAGEFNILGKSCYSLKLNLIFYGAFVGILTAIIIYLRIFTTITGQAGIAAFLMALTNAFGLLIVIMLLGHGLVRIPRHLWHQSDAKLQLRKLEKRALSMKEELTDAEHKLSSLVIEVHSLAHRRINHHELQPLIDKLVSKTPIPSEDDYALVSSINRGNSDIVEPVHRGYLERLNYRLPTVLHRRDRAAWEWRNLLEKSWYWQDVIDNCTCSVDNEWNSAVEMPVRSRWQRMVLWWWNCKLRGIFLRLLSVICILLSVIVFWSEVTLAVTSVDLSLVRPLLGIPIATEEMLIVALLFYVATCTYSSFLKLRILSYFKLVPGQHTDVASLLFFSAYFTRLIFPLGYNYLMLVDLALKTEFAHVMGTMDLFPLLGKNLNYYVPTALSLICLLVFFRFHHHISDYVESATGDDSGSDGDLIDGMELITHARREEERFLARQRYSSGHSSWRFSRSSTSLPLSSSAERSQSSLTRKRTELTIEEERSSSSASIKSPGQSLFNPWTAGP